MGAKIDMSALDGIFRAIGASTSMNPQPQVDWRDRWEWKKPLGQGGQGQTYLVRKKSDNDIQAVVKILRHPESPTARQRLHREVKNLQRLATPGVLAGKLPGVLETNVDEKTIDGDQELYIVMEYIGGRTLDNVIKEKVMPVNEACQFVMKLASIVQQVHQADIVHRDIKPANIMVLPNGNPVLIDFGLSYFNDGAESDHTITGVHEAVQTKFFVLPGRERKKEDDVALCTAVLFYCISGIRPENPERWRDVHSKAIRYPVDICRKGMNPDGTQRFGDCAELIRRVQQFLEPEPPQRPTKGFSLARYEGIPGGRQNGYSTTGNFKIQVKELRGPFQQNGEYSLVVVSASWGNDWNRSSLVRVLAEIKRAEDLEQSGELEVFRFHLDERANTSFVLNCRWGKDHLVLKFVIGGPQ